MAGSVTFDSFFDDRVIDNNGISVTDINVGLNKIYKAFNEYGFNDIGVQNYLVAEQEVGYPDLVAMKSAYGSQIYWWWLLLLNRQDDAFEGIKAGWVYTIDSINTIKDFVEESNNNNSNNNADSNIEMNNDSRIGSIVELN